MFEGWVVSIEENQNNGDDLKRGGHLAQETRTNLRMITGEQHYKKTHQDDDITGDDDDHQPAGNDFNDCESDKCREEK